MILISSVWPDTRTRSGFPYMQPIWLDHGPGRRRHPAKTPLPPKWVWISPVSRQIKLFRALDLPIGSDYLGAVVVLRRDTCVLSAHLPITMPT